MKISIIVPVYNAEKTIGRCINSIINQSYSNIEIIVINDGSTDNSLNIINDFKIKDSRIIVIDKKNEGVAATRNLGIKKALGKYIMFVDNDDYIDNNCISNFVNNIKDNDIVIGGYKRVTDNKILYKYILKDYKWSKYVIMAPWAKLYKKDFLTKNNILFFDTNIGEDVYFNLLAYSKTSEIKVASNSYYNWYYNKKSISNTIQKGLNVTIDVKVLLNKILEIDNIKEDELNIYYINRYIIWYLLFSGRNSSFHKFQDEYNSLRKWQIENKISNKISPLSRRIRGEKLKNRLIVLCFNIIESLKLIKVFSKIYCKGSDN